VKRTPDKKKEKRKEDDYFVCTIIFFHPIWHKKRTTSDFLNSDLNLNSSSDFDFDFVRGESVRRKKRTHKGRW